MTSNLCRGECFTQTDAGWIKRICNNQTNCTLKPCSGCRENNPQWELDCHKGRCLTCDILEYHGIDSSDLTLCRACSRKLVPIGTARVNGASHEDWDKRRLHKKCWLEQRKQQREES